MSSGIKCYIIINTRKFLVNIRFFFNHKKTYVSIYFIVYFGTIYLRNRLEFNWELQIHLFSLLPIRPIQKNYFLRLWPRNTVEMSQNGRSWYWRSNRGKKCFILHDLCFHSVIMLKQFRETLLSKQFFLAFSVLRVKMY